MKGEILHSDVPALLAVVFTDAQHVDNTMASHPEATRITSGLLKPGVMICWNWCTKGPLEEQLMGGPQPVTREALQSATGLWSSQSIGSPRTRSRQHPESAIRSIRAVGKLSTR
jgi:hypothetical protein